MLIKIKLWASIAGAALLAIFYALFRVERAKRKEAEIRERVAKANEKLANKKEKALDSVVSRRANAKHEIDEHLKKATEELKSYEKDILDERLPDNVVRLLNKNRNTKSSD